MVSFYRVVVFPLWGVSLPSRNEPSQDLRSTGAYLQNGFGGDLELIVVKTRREEGAYSLKSVTDEQQRLNRNQPKDAPNAF